MASSQHMLDIAKATFEVTLVRPDPTAVGRDEARRLHTLLAAVVEECTDRNIEACRSWLSHNVAHSQSRIVGFVKFLVATAKSFAGLKAARKTLHLLLLLHDVLHHSKYHAQSTLELSNSIKQHAVTLLEVLRGKRPALGKVCTEKLNALVDVWREEAMFPKDVLNRMQAIVSGKGVPALDGQVGTGNNEAGKATEGAWLLPATHGGPETPFWDLPAANFVSHIVAGAGKPIKGARVEAMKFPSRTPRASLIGAVKVLIAEADKGCSYADARDPETGKLPDLDALGQIVMGDKKTGRVQPAENYYGWSVEFCLQVKEKRRAARAAGRGTSPRRRRSSSAGRSRSPIGRQESGMQQYRSRSRSPARPSRGQAFVSGSSDGRAAERNQQFRPPVFESSGRFSAHPAPATAQLPLPPPSGPSAAMHSQGVLPPPPPPHVLLAGGWPTNVPPPPLGPGGQPLPPPPPPPANHQGMWPPPPPWGPMPAAQGQVPPPPPPPSYQQQQQQQQYHHQHQQQQQQYHHGYGQYHQPRGRGRGYRHYPSSHRR